MPISSQRGIALLAVLWLSAGLGAVALALASTVRGETERASTALDGARAYYLATGAIERAILYLEWGPRYRTPEGEPRYDTTNVGWVPMTFPGGDAVVEFIPEAAKLNINQARPEQLLALLTALGAPPDRAQLIAAAIVDWRTPAPGAGLTEFDQAYLSLTPSFRARHASFEEIEELLLVRGMTPELFYGTYAPAPDGSLVPFGGLRDCLSVYGATTQFDINKAHPAVLLSAEVPPAVVASIVERRRVIPFRREDLAAFGSEAGRLRVGGNSIFTIRATARPRRGDGQLSDLRRTVAALVKMMPAGYDSSYHILRWYDHDWRPGD
ncbi:MAG: general secretion pathway protein GspK [Bryobacterales bacterium]|nr:general secretion pathway protein GspK [Bryobacterales bacterium]